MTSPRSASRAVRQTCRRAASDPAGRRARRWAARLRFPPRRICASRSRCCSCVPWLKFSRNTSTPAWNSARIISTLELAGPRVATILAWRWRRMVIGLLARRRDQDRPEVVHVGQRRPGDHRVAERLEEAVAVVVGKAVLGLDAVLPCALERVGARGARRFLPGRRRRRCRRRARGSPGWPSSAMRERQQEFDVASAAAVAAHGDRGLAARQQDARRLERLTVARDLQRDAGDHLADVARLAFDASPRMKVGRPASRARDDRGFERHLRRRDEARLACGQARIAGLHAFAAPALQHVDARSPAASMAYRLMIASASAQVVGSGTVGPDAMSIGSSPGTSEISSVTTLAGWQAAASRPPLMADR